jgi:hypothetical protein
MKIYYLLSVFVLFLLLNQITVAQQNNFNFYPDSLNKKRLNTMIVGTSVLYGVSMVSLYNLWYKDYPQSKFHFINDNNEWRLMDKMGHSFSTYNIGRLGYASFKYTGLSEKKATWYGGMMGFTYLTVVEILDGFSEEWGASAGDLIANTFGLAFFISQQLIWKEQRIILKYSYHPTKYADYRPDLLGRNFLQSLIKDYNGSTYWASANISSFFPKNFNFPKWLNIAFGYGADGMTAAVHNSYSYNGQTIPEFKRKSQYYLSLDLDLTRIPTNSKFLHLLFNALSVLKFPMPTIELDSKGNFKFHPVYF